MAVSSEHINTEIKELTETLSKTKFENSKDVLEKFCSDHQATIIVQCGGEEQQYGTPDEVSSEKEEMLSFAQEIQFSDRAETYMLNIIAPISSSHELISALLKIIAVSFDNYFPGFIFRGMDLQPFDRKTSDRNQ